MEDSISEAENFSSLRTDAQAELGQGHDAKQRIRRGSRNVRVESPGECSCKQAHGAIGEMADNRYMELEQVRECNRGDVLRGVSGRGAFFPGAPWVTEVDFMTLSGNDNGGVRAPVVRRVRQVQRVSTGTVSGGRGRGGNVGWGRPLGWARVRFHVTTGEG